jgi:hypothetical protein
MMAGTAQTLRDVIGHGGVVFNAKNAAHGYDFMPLVGENSRGTAFAGAIFFAARAQGC